MTYEINGGKFERIADTMITKARCANQTDGDNRFKFEFLGMERALQILGLDYDIEFDHTNGYAISAVTVMGHRVEA